VRSVAEAAVARFGRIDVWVNNASVAMFGTLLTTDMADFRRMIDVNVMGYVYGTRAALEVMREQDRGVIINIASILGEVAEPYFAAYNMSKAAVMSLGVTLRSELALTGLSHIHVSTVLPATTDTPFFEHAGNTSGRRPLAMPPVYAPQKVARAIVRAASTHRKEVTIGALGATFVRLHRLAPRLVEAQMAIQADRLQLSPTEPAADTKGTLYAVPAGGRITGGWGGAEKTRNRTAVGVAVLALGAGALLNGLLRRLR
jgi:short-subunit dehydrogenase